MWPLLLGSLLVQPSAEPPPDSLAGPPPLIIKAKVEKDELVSVTTIPVTRNTVENRQRVVDGKVVTFAVTVQVTTEIKVKKVWDLKKAKITNGSGKPIDLATLRKRLAVETPVVISADGKPISKGYLNLMRAEVIIIEATLLPPPPPPPPPPVVLPLPK
jgi:hypothetical protein